MQKNIAIAFISITCAYWCVCMAFGTQNNHKTTENNGYANGLARNVGPASDPPALTLKWLTWNEAIELQKKQPKKIMIDVFTEWCGWCKRMDKSTFVDSSATAYIAANFYPVKLDAEQKADIQFNNETFKYVVTDTLSGKGVHTLAYALLDGKLGYPSIVYLNERYERILISPGYKDVPQLLTELKFVKDEAYSKQTWEEFKAKN